jgi:hypothetical protein
MGRARSPAFAFRQRNTEGDPMKKLFCAVGVLAALVATEASAQMVNLTGKYRCVQACGDGPVGAPAYVTQNGWDLNVLSQAGPSRAWVDWFSPTRIWVENWNEGAVYSPDGMIIQFDRGTIWQRDLGQPVVLRGR